MTRQSATYRSGHPEFGNAGSEAPATAGAIDATAGAALLDVVVAGLSCDTCEQFGIAGELDDVFEGEAGSAFTLSGHDQRRDLDDLSFSSGGGPGVALCT